MALIKLNHTQIANDYIDNYMPKLKPTTTLIFIAISRKTIGWHKDIDTISQSQLQKLTGLSVNCIKASIKELIDNNLITIERTGKGKGIQTYISINYISKSDILNDVNISKSDILSASNVSKFDTTKEIKEINNIKKGDKSPFFKSFIDLIKIINPSYYHDAKQAKQLKNIENRCKKDFHEAKKVIDKFMLLKNSGDKFWKDQPVTASAIYSLWDRILSTSIKQTKEKKTESVEELYGN